MTGFIVIDKPGGMSSQQVVTRVKRLLGCRKAGHTGTLDPLATGVLPVALERATRVIPFLDETVKVYRGELQLGLESDTYDREGKIVRRFAGELHFSRGQLEDAAAEFTGTILQVPPVYSAVKHQGQPLYSLARRGQQVVPPPREVTVNAFVLREIELPKVTFEVTCSRGTYVRSLVHDLGRRLGCGALLTGLQRRQSGPFRLAQAVSLGELERLEGAARRRQLLPMAEVLPAMPAVMVVDGRQREIIATGSPLPGEDLPAVGRLPEGTLCKLVDDAGNLLAIAALAREENRVQLRMKRVFL